MTGAMYLDKIDLFREMLDISRRLGYPAHWKTDLTEHDRNAIEGFKPGRYFWVVRECGTHLFENKEDAVRLLQTLCARALFTIRISPVEGMNEIFETPIGSLYNL